MYRAVTLMIAGLVLTACTSDPNAPVNQTTPIRQMDHFFNSMSDQPPPPSSNQPPASADYTHEPGYAPAYPPYDETLGN